MTTYYKITEETFPRISRYEPFRLVGPFDIPEGEMAIEGPYDEIRRLYEGLSTGGMVVVDRARFERLLTLSDVVNAVWRSVGLIGEGRATGRYDDLVAAVTALQPGDLDPLP